MPLRRFSVFQSRPLSLPQRTLLLENNDNESASVRSGGTELIKGASPARQAELAQLFGCISLDANGSGGADFHLIGLYSETDLLSDSLYKIVRYLASHRSTAWV